MFIVSLAVADLVVGVVVMPISTIYTFSQHWPFGLVLCQFWIGSLHFLHDSNPTSLPAHAQRSLGRERSKCACVNEERDTKPWPVTPCSKHGSESLGRRWVKIEKITERKTSRAQLQRIGARRSQAESRPPTLLTYKDWSNACSVVNRYI